jgi:putative transposase
VEELLFARGILVTYEAIRKWCRKFGQSYANELRHRRPRPGDKWHLDEVFLTINGAQHYLWRAVDQDGYVLDILVQSRRNKQAAKKFFRKLLKRLKYVPRVIITDKLKSYGAAKREILPDVEHRQHRYLNNRAENSHQPTRQRERRMQGFKSPGHAQRFLAAYGPIAQHFRPPRHLLSAPAYRQEMAQRLKIPDVGRDDKHRDGCLRAELVRSEPSFVPRLAPDEIGTNKLTTPLLVRESSLTLLETAATGWAIRGRSNLIATACVWQGRW